MKYSDNLITIQLWKRGILGKLLGTGRCLDKYWGDEDTKEIESWDKEQCERAYIFLNKKVLNLYKDKTPLRFLGDDICVYCVCFDCHYCSYAKRHGECTENLSDYKELCDMLIRLPFGALSFHYYTKLGSFSLKDSAEVYCNLFKGIDSGEITRDNVGEWV